MTDLSPMIYRANQWAGFYMTETSVMKELRKKIEYVFDPCFKIAKPCSDILSRKEIYYRFPLALFDLLKVIAYSKPCKISQMELFVKIAKGLQVYAPC